MSLGPALDYAIFLCTHRMAKSRDVERMKASWTEGKWLSFRRLCYKVPTNARKDCQQISLS